MKTIEVKLTEFDEKVLKHELLDIQQWVQDALDGKINNVKKRLTAVSQKQLFEDENIENIPATQEAMINLYFEQEYYKSRLERKEEFNGRERK